MCNRQKQRKGANRQRRRSTNRFNLTQFSIRTALQFTYHPKVSDLIDALIESRQAKSNIKTEHASLTNF